jgi:tetratricopeptide (TPR) repeat protein
MFRRNHAVAESNAADVLFAMKRFDEALDRERRSLAVYEAQARTDPANAAAQNDLAIGYSKIAQLLEAVGKTTEGLAEQQRATDIHRRLVARDPGSSAMKRELASDHNREGTLQAKLGMRELSLASHMRAVEISRQLTTANPSDYLLRFALALALGGRADAHFQFACAPARAGSRAADLTAAERDYKEALGTYAKLEADGMLAASDKEYVDNARAQLEKIREGC